MLVSGNIAFIRQVIDLYPLNIGNAGFLLSVIILLGAVMVFVSSLLSLLFPARIIAAVLLIITACAAYFSDRFGTITDVVMIRNTLETSLAETADLVTTELLVRLTVLAILPVVLIWVLPYSRASWKKELQYSAQTVVITIVIALLCLLPFSASYASFFREHKSVRYFINPLNPVYSAAKYFGSIIKSPESTEFKLETSSARVTERNRHRELIIFVVGETARADHFSLNGYARETNPVLSKEARLISYTSISSCGTSTSISVPCMFSLHPRHKFDIDTARNTENVIDVLAKAGINVLWRDNNSDSKGVATRIAFEDFRAPGINPECDTECRDTGMLTGLQDYVDSQQGDILIVMHQMGSHGPAYFKRYPRAFEKFSPVCRTQELGNCTQQEIINTYDNTILYTDYFLGQVIDFLKTNTPTFEAVMFYISDHGESLGENGLYLHGMPYLFAPESQTRVPALIWAGESSDIDIEKSALLKESANSHDAIARTLLELFEVETDFDYSSIAPLVYLKDKDE